MPGTQPQLYVDNLKCSAVCPRALCGARFTAQSGRSVRMHLQVCVFFSAGMSLEMACLGR